MHEREKGGSGRAEPTADYGRPGAWVQMHNAAAASVAASAVAVDVVVVVAAAAAEATIAAEFCWEVGPEVSE
jgi:hypothetical protein